MSALLRRVLFLWCALFTNTAFARNYLVVIADDLGTDKVAAYESDYPVTFGPHTPEMDTVASLSEAGVRFTRAWSSPVCVPTRASIQTGAHPSRHGLGQRLEITERGVDPDAWDLLGEVFADEGYATGFFGKWQIGNEDEAGNIGYPLTAIYTDQPHPARAGYQVFDGSLTGIGAGGSYHRWERLTWADVDWAGTSAVETEHPTEVITQSAAAWVAEQSGPWLAFLSYQAPHSVKEDGISVWRYADADPTCFRSPSLACLATESCADEGRAVYQALAECVDIQIESALWSLPPDVLDDTTIVFLGDNGTPTEASEGAFAVTGRGKGSAFESGVRIPFVIADGATWRTGDDGAIVAPGRTSSAAVHVVDLYATLLEDGLGLGSDSADSRSMVSCLSDASEDCGWGAQIGYTESFLVKPNGTLTNGNAAVRSEGMKLVVKWRKAKGCLGSILFDLDEDPLETVPVADAAAAGALRAAFEDLHDGTGSWADGLAFCS